MVSADVVVVGAGVAGLACGARLVRHGASVVVLEARNRVGGRIHTVRPAGADPVELGAQVIHGEHASTWDVVRAAGLRVAPVSRGGSFLVRLAGRTWPVGGLAAAGLTAPWSAEEELLRQPAGDGPATEVLARLGLRGRAGAMAVEWLAQTWGCDPAQLTVAGMRRRRRESTSGRGEYVVLDGYDAVAHHLATGLDVRLNAQVSSVFWNRGGVRVVADAVYDARAAVICVPPGVVATGGLRFQGPLPAAKVAAAAHLTSGDAISLVLRSRTPAPRSSWVFRVDPPGSLWRADAGSTLLRGWVKGPAAAVARRAARPWVAVAGEVFDWLRPETAELLHVADWGADPWALGGFSYPRVAAGDEAERWAEPLAGTLFFAGEATCGYRHAGLVQGALESGGRAAGELLDALQHKTAELAPDLRRRATSP